MVDWLKWMINTALIVLTVALIAVAVNLLVEMRLLQTRIDKFDTLFEKRTYDQIWGTDILQ